jgi:D-lyxose ketol-isomerase
MGDFVNVGMGGVIWVNHNHDDGGYMGHEIFLLPGQMIPEHAHVAVEGVCPAKKEAWLVRHGSIYNFSIKKEPTGFVDGVEIPESQREHCVVNSSDKLVAGELDYLKTESEMHFMIAGPEGAIVTEFATYHDNKALRFTHPKLQFEIKDEALS